MPVFNAMCVRQFAAWTTLTFGWVAALAAAPWLNDAAGQQPLDLEKSATTREPFSGTLTLRQKGGSLYYKVLVISGDVVGGYDAWKGNATHYHRIVGGWFEGRRLVLLVQSTQHDLEDKWHSHAHHFEKVGDEFILKHSLYGFGKTTNTGEVYAPHVLEAMHKLPADEVRRLMDGAEGKSTQAAASTARSDKTAKRLRRLERENARLKQLVGELVLEKSLRQEERDK